MKKIIMYMLLVLSTGISAQKYVPFPTGNVQWNVFYASKWEGSPTDTLLLKYSLQGDTIINNIQYKKVCKNIGTDSQPIYIGIGGLREQDKRIYYVGESYTSASVQFYNHEDLLYDFNKQIGDTVWVDDWRPEKNFRLINYIITNIDSVKIGNEFRKRYQTNRFYYDPEYIIEGIGNVRSGIFGVITPIPTCLNCHMEWEFICFSRDGESVYKNPVYVDCNSTQKWSEKKYLAADACWTGYTVNIFTNMVEYKNQYFLSGDTLLNGKTYKKVIGRSPNNLQQPTYYIGAIREEAGKIFKQYTDYETQVVGEFLLYDFDVKVGDTIHSTAPSGELSRKPVVTRIDTIELLTGEKRKRFSFNEASQWVEGIGSTSGLFSQTYEHPTNGKIENLVCFKQGGIEYYKNNSLCSDGTCCDVLAGLEAPQLLNQSISLSPNPTNRLVRLDFSKSINRCKSIKLMDAVGNTLQKSTKIGNTDFELDLMRYSQGLYFVVIEFEKSYELHKVIKF